MTEKVYHKVTKTGNKNSEMNDMTPPPSNVDDNVIIAENTKTDYVLLTAKSKSDNTFNCIICEKSFSGKHNLIVHDKRVHTKQGSDSTYKCDNCNSTFINKVKLSDHILKEHEKCKVCEKSFSK